MQTMAVSLQPTPQDRELAQTLAERLVRAGRGRVRTVALIGSRARGDATAESDFDLVVIVELDQNAIPWNGDAADAERNRLMSELGTTPRALDVTVRSVDQFEEARSVIGGVERLLDLEGVVLYSRQLDRAPSPQRSREQVRLALTRAWMQAAGGSIASALSAEKARLAGGLEFSGSTGAGGAFEVRIRPVIDPKLTARHYLKRSVQQAITALCVMHQLETSKHHSLRTYVLPLLDEHAPRACQRLIRCDLECVSLATAVSVLDAVFPALPTYVQQHPRMRRLASDAMEWRRLSRAAS